MSVNSDSGGDDGAVGSEADSGLLPISYKTLSLLFYVGILVWIVYLTIEMRTWDRYEDWIIPLAGISLLIIALLIQIARETLPDSIKPSVGPSPDATETEIDEMLVAGDEEQAQVVDKRLRDKRLLILSTWIIALPILLYYFGFVLVLPVYLMAFEYFLTRDIKNSLLVTTVSLIILYVVFVLILEVQIWDGIISHPLDFIVL